MESTTENSARTNAEPARPVDNYEDWQREQRRIRARAHANQARLALAEARNKRTSA